MNIVFIVGSYYPNYSAVGKCVGNVANVLSEKHNVTVICGKNELSQSQIEYYHNQKIIRVSTRNSEKQMALISKLKESKGFSSKKYKWLLNILKMLQFVEVLFSKTAVKRSLINSYVDALCAIDSQIDLIIPASMPFESVVSAIKFREQTNYQASIVPYLFDQFVENESLHRFKANMSLKRKKNQQIEKRMIEESSKILVVKHLMEYFTREYPQLTSKFTEVEHPLIVNLQSFNSQNEEQNNHKKAFTYTGSFYSKIRNPKFMLDVFNLFLAVQETELNVYSFGDCEATVKEYARLNSRIKAHGFIQSSQVSDKLGKTSFLVALGNSVNNQVPSKVFDYLSYGKPIIYFYSCKDDSNVQVLEHYSNSLCINQRTETIESAVKLLNEFWLNHQNAIVPFDEIKELYFDALPEYTANLIEKVES